MSKISTYSLERHKNLFNDESNNSDYLYVAISEHPYINVPYRAESYAIEFLKKGSIIMQTELSKVIVNAPAIFTIGPNVIRSFSKNSEEIQMEIIFFKPEFFLKHQANIFFLSQFDFFEKADRNVFSLKKKNLQKMQSLFKSIRDSANAESRHQAAIVRNYLYILIFELDNSQLGVALNTFDKPIFLNFKEILYKDFATQRSVSYYAKNLHITGKHLSEVLKNNSGKTARQWIDEVVVLEAKILLENRKLTISQISTILNFSTQSVFGKFFKKQLGISPTTYRSKIR